MSAITAKASRKMKKYAVLTREPRCFLGSFDFSWEQRKVGEVSESYSGGTPSVGVKEYYGGQIPFIRSAEINSEITELFLTEEGLKNSSARLVAVGDILYALYGATSGEVGRARLKGAINQAILAIKPHTDYDSEYLAQWLRKSKHSIIETYLQGGQGNLSGTIVKELSVDFPSLKEQKAIGDFFRQLDNLITLHQRKCANLCSPSQVVFSLLFATSTFSWEQRKLSEITDKVTEKNAGLQYVETFTNSAEFGIISQRDFFDHDIAKLGSLDGYYIVKNEDFVYNPRISTSAPVGPINRNKLGRTGVMSPLYTVFRPHDIDTTYLEYFFKCGYWHSFMNFNGDSGARSDRFSIRDNVFFQMPIPIPDIDEQRKIGELLTCLDNLITLHQRECISFTGRADRLILTANKKRTTSSWEQRKLGELVDRVVRKNINNESTLPLTISAQYGLVDQITYFNNRVASRDVSNYYLVLNGEFAYNKSTSDGYPFGAVKRLDLYEKGVLSTLYIVFAPKKEQQIDSDYLTVFFDTDRWHKGVAERAAEGARNHGLLNISAEDFFDIDLSVPKDIVEQKQIGAFIRQLDHLITLHQRKPFLMKWRTSDANRNQTNRLVL